MYFQTKAAEIKRHGEERIKKHVVDGGRLEYFKREKYCIEHGWSDILTIGGRTAWHELHHLCIPGECSQTSIKRPKAAKNKLCAGNFGRDGGV